MRHDPQFDDPYLETDRGPCPGCDECDWDSLPDRLNRFIGSYDCPDGVVEEARDRIEDLEAEMDATKREQSRLCRAIGHYAHHAPLDLKSASEIQHDLMAICGEKHTHRRSIGSDACDLCGRDLRHEVHLRESEQ